MQTVFYSSLTLLASAYSLQHFLHWQPCPLCELQRLSFWGIACWSGLGLLHRAFLQRTLDLKIYKILIRLTAMMGIGVALRHIWVQTHPEQFVQGCTPPLAYLLEHLPWAKAWDILIHSEGSCTNTQEKILGVNLPVWSFLGLCGCFMLTFLSSNLSSKKQK